MWGGVKNKVRRVWKIILKYLNEGGSRIRDPNRTIKFKKNNKINENDHIRQVTIDETREKKTS